MPTGEQIDLNTAAPDTLQPCNQIGLQFPFKFGPFVSRETISLDIVDAASMPITELESCALDPVIE